MSDEADDGVKLSPLKQIGVNVKKKSENSYGLGSNILFMFREQWHFEPKAFLYPIIYILFDLAAVFLAICPKQY